MEILIVLIVAPILAFWMGYSVNQGGTCAVATAHELLHHRRPRRFVALMATSAAAGMIALALLWSRLEGIQLAHVTALSVAVVGGAVVFGVGATVNDACLLGSLGRLGDGELRLLALPPGLAVGFWLADALLYEHRPTVFESVLITHSEFAGAAMLGFFAIFVASVMFISRPPFAREGARRWSLGASSAILGVTGGALYATAPAWTYADLVSRSLPLSMAVSAHSAIPTVLSSLAGAVVAARRRGTWRPRRGSRKDLWRTLFGGLLMGMGAALIPGGNDGLVLAAIPALSPGGIAAYLIMTLVIVACLAVRPRLIRLLRF